MVFEELFAVNVNGFTEKKKVDENTELTYLSWAYAWAEVKKRYPEAVYEIEKFDNLPYVYDPNTGYMVYTTVTIEGITHEMWLPVMDGKNKAMKAEPYTYKVRQWDRQTRKYTIVDRSVAAATMFDINKTIMRCLVKNLAMFGLGLYIYAGEDLPITDEEKPAEKPKEKPEEKTAETPKERAQTAGKRAPEQGNALTAAERAAERAADAYPERDIMIAKLSAALNPAEMQKWLDMWGVTALADARGEALMGMYSYYEQKGRI